MPADSLRCDTVTYHDAGGQPQQADLYRPAGQGPFPVLLALHGGGWRRGQRGDMAPWGNFLATHGIAVLATSYLKSPDRPSWPGNVRDVATALAHLAASAAQWDLDPERIGVLGASAGAHLGALALLAADRPFIAEAVPSVPPVRAFVGVYGAYDLFELWQADLAANHAQGEQFSSRMLGAAPFDDPQLYVDASPLRHVRYGVKGLKTLLIWGTEDSDVPPTQSTRFATVLQQARGFVRTLPVPGAGHFWFNEEPIDAPGSFTAYVAPRLLRFLQQHL